MNSELYTAASGLLVQERRLEQIANNLANVNTPGFRPQKSFTEVYTGIGGKAPSVLRLANAAVALAGNYEVPGPGPSRSTGRPLDVALPANEYFAVDTAAGRRYTRAGNLDVDASGNLVDAAGNPILGADGKPVSGLGPGAEITAGGEARDTAGTAVKLLVVRDPENLLRPQGGNLRTAAGNDGALETVSSPKLRAGFLESSGTDPVRELVEMVEAQRAFESYQRLITMTMHEVNRKAVNELVG
jgi:flagellar basal-body rod protein FlgG